VEDQGRHLGLVDIQMISSQSLSLGTWIRIGDRQSFAKIITPPPFSFVGGQLGVALQTPENKSFYGDLDFEPGLQ